MAFMNAYGQPTTPWSSMSNEDATNNVTDMQTFLQYSSIPTPDAPDEMDYDDRLAELLIPSLARNQADNTRWDTADGVWDYNARVRVSPHLGRAWANYTYFPAIHWRRADHPEQVASGQPVTSGFTCRMWACFYTSFRPSDQLIGHRAEFVDVALDNDKADFVLVDTALLRGVDAVRSLISALRTTHPTTGAYIWFRNMSAWTLGPGGAVNLQPEPLQGVSFGLALAACIMRGPPVAYTGFLRSMGTEYTSNSAPMPDGRLPNVWSADDVVEEVRGLPYKVVCSVVNQFPLVIPHKSTFNYSTMSAVTQKLRESNSAFLYQYVQRAYSTVDSCVGRAYHLKNSPILLATTLPEALQLACYAYIVYNDARAPMNPYFGLNADTQAFQNLARKDEMQRASSRQRLRSMSDLQKANPAAAAEQKLAAAQRRAQDAQQRMLKRHAEEQQEILESGKKSLTRAQSVLTAVRSGSAPPKRQKKTSMSTKQTKSYLGMLDIPPKLLGRVAAVPATEKQMEQRRRFAEAQRAKKEARLAREAQGLGPSVRVSNRREASPVAVPPSARPSVAPARVEATVPTEEYDPTTYREQTLRLEDIEGSSLREMRDPVQLGPGAPAAFRFALMQSVMAMLRGLGMKWPNASAILNTIMSVSHPDRLTVDRGVGGSMDRDFVYRYIPQLRGALSRLTVSGTRMPSSMLDWIVERTMAALTYIADEYAKTGEFPDTDDTERFKRIGEDLADTHDAVVYVPLMEWTNGNELFIDGVRAPPEPSAEESTHPGSRATGKQPVARPTAAAAPYAKGKRGKKGK